MHNNSQICSNLKKKCFIYNIIRTQKERNFHNITHLVQPKSTASIKNSCHIQPSNTANRNFVLFVNSLNPPCTQNKIIENPLIVSYSSRPHLCCRLSPHYSMTLPLPLPPTICEAISIAMPLATILIGMVETNETETKSSLIRSSDLTLSSLKSPTPTPYSDSFPPTPHDLCNPMRQKRNTLSWFPTATLVVGHCRTRAHGVRGVEGG